MSETEGTPTPIAEALATDTPHAWVGCLACYNDGTLRGEWVDASEASEFVPCEGRGHEEWWVFDHENFGGLLDSECSPMEAQRLAEVIETLQADHQPVEAFAAYCANNGDTPSLDLIEAFADAFRGKWDSERAYAENLADDLGLVDDSGYRWPTSYIDWDAATRDLFMDGYWSSPAPGGVYVFDSNA